MRNCGWAAHRSSNRLGRRDGVFQPEKTVAFFALLQHPLTLKVEVLNKRAVDDSLAGLVFSAVAGISFSFNMYLICFSSFKAEKRLWKSRKLFTEKELMENTKPSTEFVVFSQNRFRFSQKH